MADNNGSTSYGGGGGAASPVSSPASSSAGGGGGGGGRVREQDRLLPIANVGRIMKRALPANAKISKEAKETVQECVSEFISFITGEASEKCHREKRKTINGDDLLYGITTLGFEDYVEPLKLYLQRYRELEGDRTTAASSSAVSNGGAQQYGHMVMYGGQQQTPSGGAYASHHHHHHHQQH
ncbi:nuclear transcription factor Y subunit B-1 [Cryptomeria japonica]|uniref:nuclear transcription factor Y subunit B-1 n=1 Tax=Cryptomeria japonica TaxID=3369 RepID=UPI0027DA69BD|nr:nuclear transcription factor Y subunit B-1 [Cryptomeria japonica]XP_057840157.2 nuclear transcription factor Y subunit B-1 [Cryptomeria japonica]